MGGGRREGGREVGSNMHTLSLKFQCSCHPKADMMCRY